MCYLNEMGEKEFSRFVRKDYSKFEFLKCFKYNEAKFHTRSTEIYLTNNYSEDNI